MKSLDILTDILLIVGGLNWALVGATGIDLVAFLVGLEFGQRSSLSSAVYLLVGAAAFYKALGHASAPRRREAAVSRSR